MSVVGGFYRKKKTREIANFLWICRFFVKSYYHFSFEITHWTKPGPIQRQALKELITDKQALFCLLTDKIDSEILNEAKNLKVIGKKVSY